MSKSDISKTRLTFWVIWTASISMPVSLGAYLILGNRSLMISPVIMIVLTVFGFNYCEWLIKRRQWRETNTVILCQCGHQEESHGATYDMDRACYHVGPGGHGGTLRRDCVCQQYDPRFWQMSGRV